MRAEAVLWDGGESGVMPGFITATARSTAAELHPQAARHRGP